MRSEGQLSTENGLTLQSGTLPDEKMVVIALHIAIKSNVNLDFELLGCTSL